MEESDRDRPKNEWAELLSFLPLHYRELAKEHRQLETKFGNSKIRTAEDLLQLIFLHVGANLPLRQTVTLVAKSEGGLSVSHVTLHQKMRLASPYLQALVNEMNVSQFGATELWSGYEVIAIDATTDSSPGSTGTDARVHTAIRVSDLSVLHAEVTDVSGGETLKRFPLKPGQLVLADRGYSNGPGIASAVKKGADVLIRLNRGALPLYEKNGTLIDVMEWLRSLKGRRVGERKSVIYTEFEGESMVINGRLVAVRLPKDKAEEAQQRVRKEYGNKTTSEMLEAAKYVALFTTVPDGRMKASHCIELYRLRWQVELLFKRWKSICGLDRLPNEIKETILSWVLGKILLALIMDRMGSAATELFPPMPKRPAERKQRRIHNC